MRTIDILNGAVHTYPAGSQQTSRINLLPGEQHLLVTLTTADWPAVSDGTISIRFLMSRQGGPLVEEWHDTFQHVKLFKQGVEWPTMSFGCGLQAPFQAGDDFVVQKDADVDISTAIKVEIT